MFYFVKTKGQLLRLRDAKSGEMKHIGPGAWVPFESLPVGIAVEPGSHHDIDVRVARTDEDLAAVDADNKLLADVEARCEAKRKARAAFRATLEKKPSAAPEAESKDAEDKPKSRRRRW